LLRGRPLGSWNESSSNVVVVVVHVWAGWQKGEVGGGVCVVVCVVVCVIVCVVVCVVVVRAGLGRTGVTQ
jgi:hypothetical protein